MADMHRAGRVGGHVFDVDLRTFADGAAAILRPRAQDGAQLIDPGRGLEREIDEARACYVDLLDQVIGTQASADRVGKLARLLAGILGQHHGGIGGHVAMRSVTRRLDHDARLVDAGRQDASRGERAVGGAHLVEDGGEDVLFRHRGL